ncbi:lipoprotein [Glaciecola sp. KUL10]|nr:lipoprotein [Glaciecola sp. KUL10]
MILTQQRLINFKKIVVLIALLSLGGCASNINAWERGRLAKTEMQFEPDPMRAAFMRHVYASKEASTGGSSTAGGGCGCN